MPVFHDELGNPLLSGLIRKSKDLLFPAVTGAPALSLLLIGTGVIVIRGRLSVLTRKTSPFDDLKLWPTAAYPSRANENKRGRLNHRQCRLVRRPVASTRLAVGLHAPAPEF